jgi:hypothetical protein
MKDGAGADGDIAAHYYAASSLVDDNACGGLGADGEFADA